MPTDIAPAMSDNEALRRILSSMQSMEVFLKQEYDSIATTADVTMNTSTAVAIRAAESDAVATVIANKGANDVYIYEDTKHVATVKAGTSLQLPLTGKGAITGKSITGATTVRASTYILN